MKPTFTLTPSIIARVIRQSSQLKSDFEVISAFESLAQDLQAGKEPSINRTSDEELFVDETIPENLRPFAEALFGAVSVEDEQQS